MIKANVGVMEALEPLRPDRGTLYDIRDIPAEMLKVSDHEETSNTPELTDLSQSGP